MNMSCRLSFSGVQDKECKCEGADAAMLVLAALATGVVYTIITMGGIGGRRRKRSSYMAGYNIDLELKGIGLI